jgi:hypothetical protein
MGTDNLLHLSLTLHTGVSEITIYSHSLGVQHIPLIRLPRVEIHGCAHRTISRKTKPLTPPWQNCPDLGARRNQDLRSRPLSSREEVHLPCAAAPPRSPSSEAAYLAMVAARSGMWQQGRQLSAA